MAVLIPSSDFRKTLVSFSVAAMPRWGNRCLRGESLCLERGPYFTDRPLLVLSLVALG